ncbi:MAG: serine/threonine protein kinase [Magnetococcus sp. XQGC-1]
MIRRPWLSCTLLLLLFLASDLAGLMPYLEERGVAMMAFLLKNSSNIQANYLESLPLRWGLYGGVWLFLVAILPRLSPPWIMGGTLLLWGSLLLGDLLCLLFLESGLPVLGPFLLLLAGYGIFLISRAVAPPQTEMQQIGHYQIGAVLGTGSTGTVHTGRDLRTQQEVAIKLFALQHHPTQATATRQRFLQEAAIAGRLHHPHIVQILDQGEEEGVAYLVMERLTGHSLERYARPTPEHPLLPLPLVILIVARVAMALEHAHKNQVVHRDIKPANILFNPATGQVKVMDFGSALPIPDAGRDTGNPGSEKTRRVVGTPYYLSPEQLLGKPVDGRSDLFSLGVLFFELLSGTLPFPARDMSNLLLQISRESPVDLLTLRPNLSPELRNIVEKALQKNVAKRYQSGRELTRDLTEYVKYHLKTAGKNPANSAPA